MAGDVEEFAVACHRNRERESIGANGGQKTAFRNGVDRQCIRHAHQVKAIAGGIVNDVRGTAHQWHYGAKRGRQGKVGQ